MGTDPNRKLVVAARAGLQLLMFLVTAIMDFIDCWRLRSLPFVLRLSAIEFWRRAMMRWISGLDARVF